MSELTINHLFVTAGEKQVVFDVSLSLLAGEVAILMGPNGSGKSTLVNALMGHPHYTVTQGEVLLDGESILTLAPHERARKGMFLSLQHTPKVGGVTLATFLHAVHTARTGEQVDVLEYYLRMRDLADEYGIRKDLLDRPLTEGLSGGERKLSETLQLIAFKPQVACLDEIDSGVDVDALRVVCGAVSRLAHEGTAFLLISHHPSLLEHLSPQRVHLMANGRLVRSAGRELADLVHREGFCQAIACPMVEGCEAAGRAD